MTLLFCVFGALAFPRISPAQSDMMGLGNLSDTTLTITSDKLLANRDSKHIIFSGNVVAVYGDKTIHSDKLKVTYLEAPANQNQAGSVAEKIDKIIATGSVVIQFENKTAYCDQAVYDQNTETLVLTGKDARLQSDDNYVTGEKITVRQRDGQVIVNGNPENRVNAVFKPDKPLIESKKNQHVDDQK